VREVRHGPSGEGCIIVRRSAAAAAFLVCLLFVFAPLCASAHARFDNSTPAAGVEVQSAPALVTLRFDDDVEISLGSLHVFDAGGVDRAIGAPYHPAGNPHDVQVRTPSLARGSYTVVWQVVADDGHVGNGRFSFGVDVPAAVIAPNAETAGSPATAAIVAVLRFALLGGMLIAIGLAIGARLVVRPPASAPVSMLEFGAWLVVAFVAFVDIRVQSVITGGTLIAALNTRYGVLHLTLTIAALLGAIAVSGGRRRWELLITAAIVVLVSESLGGHAASGAQPSVGVVFDAVHLLAAATWIGVLLTTLMAAEIVDVRRTSTVATYAVAALVFTAVKQVLQNVSAWSALITTPYGLEICAKIVLLAIVVAVAYQSRRRVSGGAVAVASSVRLEVLLLTAVIAVTAVLVDSHPPR
jgi:copper transport protein